MSQLHELSALELAAAIAAREVSPVEVAEHHLDRIAALGAQVGAFVTVTDQLALAQARAAEQAVLAGDPLSPLHGVPVPIKDLNNVAGVPVTYGSAAYRDYLAPVDDHSVTALRRAGTVCLGKTNTPEFGLPCYTENAVAPPARTPWDTSRSAGGSSGGAGAAVATGLAPLALGSDGGGSLRIPASVCGLVGLKPARGRVSSGPLRGDVSGLGSDGPIGRTVADVAACLDAIAGPFPGDPHWAPPLPRGDSFLAAAAHEPGRLRIARFATPVIVDVPVHPACLAAWEEASALLADLGHEVVDIAPPITRDVVPDFETVWSVLATLTPVPDGAEGLLMPLTRHLRGLGAAVTGTAFAQAVVRMQLAARTAVSALASYDAVLTPTLADLPAPVGAIRNEADPAADFEANKRFTPFTALWNVTGQPAISLPLHWTEPLEGAPRGLPVGVMLAGRPVGEPLLLSLAAQLETARPWRHRVPPLW